MTGLLFFCFLPLQAKLLSNVEHVAVRDVKIAPLTVVGPAILRFAQRATICKS